MKQLLLYLLLLPALAFPGRAIAQKSADPGVITGQVRLDYKQDSLITAATTKANAALSGVSANTAALATKITGTVVADRTALLLVALIANTIIEITVLSDSRYGNGVTKYNLFPNGDRYLVAFLTVKDN